MLEFIVKYWVGWVFGLIATGLGFVAKHYYKLHKTSKEQEIKESHEALKKELLVTFTERLEEETNRSNEEDKKIETKIETLSQTMDNLTTGILSIQGKQFRDFCLMLLEPNHIITTQEYEQFEEDYDAYKALRGNHRGDALHDRVVDKFRNSLR